MHGSFTLYKIRLICRIQKITKPMFCNQKLLRKRYFYVDFAKTMVKEKGKNVQVKFHRILFLLIFAFVLRSNNTDISPERR